MKTLKEIKQMPTTHNMVHESIYRSHATLQLVKDMLNRGDSNESILMVLEDLYTPSEAEIKETVNKLKRDPVEFSLNIDGVDLVTKFTKNI